MIKIEEIAVENINDYWKIHQEYLVNDKIITSDEELEYFTSSKYRDIIKSHMLRKKDKCHMVYFVRDQIRIGATHYVTYQSEDGKCFILDFWVFPEYRGQGTGHDCFKALEAYTKADGAMYYELNAFKPNSQRFWKDLGFRYIGIDEHGLSLLIKD